MKKSECFRLAQLAVLKDSSLCDSVKLEVIRELQDKEGTALYVERTEAEKSLKEACQAERGDTENAENGK